MSRISLLGTYALVMLLFACASTGVERSPQQAEALYKVGVAYLKENKIQQAFVEFQKAYEHDPGNKDILNAIGIIYLLHFDETEKAIDYFQKAVKEDPLYSEANNNLGFAYEKLNRFEDSIPYYRKALSNLTYATPEKAFINMGNAYYRMRKYSSAVDSFKEAIKRNPSLSLAYLRLALCFNALGKYGDAASAMTEAVRIDPFFAGDRQKAFDQFTRRKLSASGYEEQDLTDYLEILRY